MPGDPVRPKAPSLLRAITAGHRGDTETARSGLEADDPRVRDAALGALSRIGALAFDDVERGLGDPAASVRRRACDVAAVLGFSEELGEALRTALADSDPLVVEAACWALGEHADDAEPTAVADLCGLARSHDDTRAREAAVAALGAIGDPEGLAAIFDALGDKPTIRRRAVVALAAFDGDEVHQALVTAAADRDWQVREVAEILLEAEGADEEDEFGVERS